MAIESANGAGRILPGAVIETGVGEVESLLLNGRHRVVVNAGSKLVIQSLGEMGRAGCLVNLVLGEVYVHVEYDGDPFVIQTAHGRAVVTGTTFDVKATDADTTLVVAEGSVRFESAAGAARVVAGQVSRITADLVPPSMPTSCDSTALTTWAGLAGGETQVVQNIPLDDFILDDLPMAATPWAEVRTDLDRIDYAQWIEQKRGWFKRQFPWIFELREALAKEGIEADYPILLLQSKDIWRFAYPQIGMDRQVEPDLNGLLRVATCYGRNGSWLQQQALPSLRATGRGQQVTGPEAFERWAKMIEAQLDQCLPKVSSGLVLDTVNACLYLANTRALAILAIRHGFEGTGPQNKGEILSLLQQEFQILAGCMNLSYGLDLARPNADPCQDLQRLNALIGEVKRIGEIEKKVKEYEKALSR